MIRRRHINILIAVLSVLCTLSGYAQQDILLGEIAPQGLAQGDVNIRVKDGKWQFIWDFLDTGNYRSVMIDVSPYVDELYGHEAYLTYGKTSDGVTETSPKVKAVYSGEYFPLRLTKDLYDYSTLVAGDNTPVLDGNGLFMAYPGSKLILRPLSKARDYIDHVEIISHLPIVTAPFLSVEELEKYLSQSRDSIEGMWEYLDRNMPAGKVAPGGQYRLATVHNTETGNYDIYYVSGADRFGHLWKPLMLKGTLMPTVFVGNFDLMWDDAARAIRYSKDTSASLTHDNSLLTLSFPLLKSELRLRRCVR